MEVCLEGLNRETLLCCFSWRVLGVEERRSYRCATNLFENSRLEPAISCDGEPVPDRVLLDIMLLEFILPGRPKTDLAVVDKGSIGEFVAEGELERFWLAECEE